MPNHFVKIPPFHIQFFNSINLPVRVNSHKQKAVPAINWNRLFKVLPYSKIQLGLLADVTSRNILLLSATVPCFCVVLPEAFGWGVLTVRTTLNNRNHTMLLRFLIWHRCIHTGTLAGGANRPNPVIILISDF